MILNVQKNWEWHPECRTLRERYGPTLKDTRATDGTLPGGVNLVGPIGFGLRCT